MTDPDEYHHESVTTERSLNTLLVDIVGASSIEQALEVMLDGIATLTSAALLYFECQPDGDYRLTRTPGDADTRDPDPSLHVAGAELVGHLPSLLSAGHTAFEPHGTVLHSNIAGDHDIELTVQPLGPFDSIFWIDAAATVPLRFANEDVGALVAVWPLGTPITTCAREARHIDRAASVAAPTVQRLLRIERLRNLVAESETIRRLTDSVARTPSFTGSLDIICRSARLITGLDLVATAMTTSDHVTWNAASGAIDPSFLGSRIAMADHFIRDIMQRGQEVILSDVRAHPELEPKLIPVHTREALRSSVTIPVYVNARLRAILLFGSRRVRPYQPCEVRTMHAIAGTVATAIAAGDVRLATSDNA